MVTENVALSPGLSTSTWGETVTVKPGGALTSARKTVGHDGPHGTFVATLVTVRCTVTVPGTDLTPIEG